MLSLELFKPELSSIPKTSFKMFLLKATKCSCFDCHVCLQQALMCRSSGMLGSRSLFCIDAVSTDTALFFGTAQRSRVGNTTTSVIPLCIQTSAVPAYSNCWQCKATVQSEIDRFLTR